MQRSKVVMIELTRLVGNVSGREKVDALDCDALAAAAPHRSYQVAAACTGGPVVVEVVKAD